MEFELGDPIDTESPRSRRVGLDYEIGGPIDEEEKAPGFTGSFARGVDELQATGFGALGMAGSALGLDSVRDFGIRGYERNIEEAAENAPTVRFRDIKGVGDTGTWAKETLGARAPSMV